MFFKKKYFLKDFTLNELKEKTRVLLIDDEDRNNIVRYLEQEHWHARWVQDIESMEDTELKDSHIIFVDILGVGKKLEKVNEGLDLIVSIKEKYPEKKVVVYSSKSSHDIFHKANDLVDKRIKKGAGDLETFRLVTEELSKKCFNWSYVSEEIYDLISDLLPPNVRKEQLSQLIINTINRNRTVNIDKLRKSLQIGEHHLSIIITLINLALKVM